MSELRKDYVLDRYVIIATERGKRPDEFKKEEQKSEGTDYFAPGNEEMTPPEIMRVPDPNAYGGWQVRVFPNKFPAVKPAGDANIKTDNHFFTYSDGYGHHEIIVESPKSDMHFADMETEQLVTVLKVYQQRITELYKDKNIAYVHIFKNHGEEAGASLPHTHTQIIALNTVPKETRMREEAVRMHESCPYCAVKEMEKDSYRKVCENDHAIAFTPYASQFTLQCSIFPKRHVTSITGMSDNELKALAETIKKVMAPLKSINAPYNMVIYNASPEGIRKAREEEKSNMHFYIDVYARLNKFAGQELGSGIFINPITPEQAAAFYRGEGGVGSVH